MRTWEQGPPIPHHFVVRTEKPETEKRFVEQMAEWIRRELSVAHHDQSITVEVVYE